MSNDYKYGVEYACNGVKPDLPDDVVIMVRSAAYGFESFSERDVGHNAWELTTGFKIVDKRYHPDRWHQRGELPPAGTDCEYTIGDNFGGYKRCCFVGFNSRGSLVIELSDGELKSFHKHQIKFRPLRTEREKFIDAAMSTAPDCHKLEDVLGALFDAGFSAPEKERKE